ncbi:exportin-5-like [Ambystoma mexicanum]|uniref:exportin-5-like n=1 Tax=Ambystoma mexicanum TaxID=8296 RepID=UPI0037E8C3DE
MAAIHVRLGKEWQIIGQRMNGKQDERPVSLDNVDEEQVRLLTQEIIRFIDSCCVTNKDGDPNVMAAKSLDDDDDDGGDDDNVGKDTQSPQASSLGLTELGKCLMKETDIRASLLITAFSSLEWNDSLTCYRSATHVCWPLLNHVVSEPLLPDAVAYFFTMVLKGLKQHTGHSVYIDALVQLGFQIYEALRPRYTKLKDVLQQLPEIRDYFLLTYDKKVLCTPISAQDYVLRKYCFARLIQGYVGRSLTEVPIEETKAGNQPPASKKLKSLVPPTMEQKSPSGNQEHLTSPNSYEAPFGHPEHIRPLMLETSLRRPGPQMAHFNEMARFRLPAQNAGHFMPGGRGTMLIRSFLGTPPFFPPRFR